MDFWDIISMVIPCLVFSGAPIISSIGLVGGAHSDPIIARIGNCVFV